jgi:hypothetical protein
MEQQRLVLLNRTLAAYRKEGAAAWRHRMRITGVSVVAVAL